MAATDCNGYGEAVDIFSAHSHSFVVDYFQQTLRFPNNQVPPLIVVKATAEPEALCLWLSQLCSKRWLKMLQSPAFLQWGERKISAWMHLKKNWRLLKKEERYRTKSVCMFIFFRFDVRHVFLFCSTAFSYYCWTNVFYSTYSTYSLIW